MDLRHTFLSTVFSFLFVGSAGAQAHESFDCEGTLIGHGVEELAVHLKDDRASTSIYLVRGFVSQISEDDIRQWTLAAAREGVRLADIEMVLEDRRVRLSFAISGSPVGMLVTLSSLGLDDLIWYEHGRWL